MQHKKTLADIASLLNLNYSSVRTLVTNFRKTSRTNKLLTYKTKRALLRGRREEKTLLKKFQKSKSLINGD